MNDDNTLNMSELHKLKLVDFDYTNDLIIEFNSNY